MRNRRIGIEVEFSEDDLYNLNLLTIKRRLRESVTKNFKSYRHYITSKSSSSKWAFKEDHCGREITTPALTSSYSNLILLSRTFFDFKESFSVSNPLTFSNCGLHVHIDVDDFDTNSIFSLYYFFIYFEDIIFYIVHPQRRDTYYVHPVRKILPRIKKIYNMKNKDLGLFKLTHRGHHLGINPRKIEGSDEKKIGRFEVRYAKSTCDKEYIFRWCQFLLTVFEMCKKYDFLEWWKKDICDSGKNDIPMSSFRGYYDHLISFLISHKTGVEWLDSKKKDMIKWIHAQREVYRPD